MVASVSVVEKETSNEVGVGGGGVRNTESLSSSIRWGKGDDDNDVGDGYYDYNNMLDYNDEENNDNYNDHDSDDDNDNDNETNL